MNSNKSSVIGLLAIAPIIFSTVSIILFLHTRDYRPEYTKVCKEPRIMTTAQEEKYIFPAIKISGYVSDVERGYYDDRYKVLLSTRLENELNKNRG